VFGDCEYIMHPKENEFLYCIIKGRVILVSDDRVI
jgi:hypothetical protein